MGLGDFLGEKGSSDRGFGDSHPHIAPPHSLPSRFFIMTSQKIDFFQQEEPRLGINTYLEDTFLVALLLRRADSQGCPGQGFRPLSSSLLYLS